MNIVFTDVVKHINYDYSGCMYRQIKLEKSQKFPKRSSHSIFQSSK